MSEFSEWAPAYVAAGWPVIPFLREGEDWKALRLSGITGEEGLDAAPAQVEEWRSTYAAWPTNIGVRTPAGVVGLDVDVYVKGDVEKRGDLTLAGLEQQHGPLPATWTSTARGGAEGPGVSRILFFRLSEPTKIVANPGPGIETIQRHHRYAVVMPSLHQTAGTRYQWYGATGAPSARPPVVSELPLFPESWRTGLASHSQATGLKASRGETAPYLEQILGDYRDMCPEMQNAADKWAAAMTMPGASRHDQGVKGAWNVLHLAFDGHTGAGEVLAELESVFLTVTGGGSRRQTDWERHLTDGAQKVLGEKRVIVPECFCWEDMERTARRSAASPPPTSASPGRLPESFWESSPLLSHIRLAAAARDASPDAVFHAVLARFASGLPFGTVVNGALGTDPLHHFVALIGASGSGKSLAARVARELLEPDTPIWGHVSTRVREVPIGSGQGMIECFMGDVSETRTGPDGKPLVNALTGEPKLFRSRAQTEHNALFIADEGRQVLSVGRASESVVFPVLCSLWSGEKVGQANATAERTRMVEAGSYSVGAVLGFQPETIADLFADDAGGTPQRFCFADAMPPWSLDAEMPAWPGPLQLPILGCRVAVELDADARADAVTLQRRLNRGQLDGAGTLDGHVVRVRARVAGLLALVHGELTVTPGWWSAAETVCAASRVLRDHLARFAVERERTARLSAARDAAAAQAEGAAEVAQRREEAKITATAQRITEVARRLHAEGKRSTAGHVRGGLGKAQRDVRVEALEYAVSAGWVTVSETGDVVPIEGSAQ